MIEVVSGQDNSSTIVAEMKGSLERALAESAQAVADTAKQTVHRRSGETAASVQAHEDGSVTVDGAALFLEFGTVHMPGFPFLGPAFDQEEEHFVEKCKEA
jgi:HK97 gp10 family phage protein